MNNLILFAYESGVCMAVLFGMYWIFLRKETYYRFNRIYLLGTILIASMLPLGNFSLFESSSEPSVLNVISSMGEAVRIPEVTVAMGSTSGFSLSNNWQHLVIVIYLLGTLMLLARIILGIFRIHGLKKTGRRIDHDGYSVIYIKQQFAPFSFFRTIFINESLMDGSERCNVIDHEVLHIKQFHTYDIVITEIFLAIFWFNPFMWFLKRALRNTHEYLADNGVITTGTSLPNYQSLLLKQIHGLPSLVVTNEFNSMIKNRIKMMCITKSSFFAKLKPLLIAPILLCITLIFACHTEQVLPEINRDEIFIVAEEMPYYPGGEDALYEFINNNIKYPESALKNEISGQTIVRFCITSQGDVTQISVMRGVDLSLDAEAIRVVKSLPDKFTPGKQAGKPVNVWYVVRVEFQLPDTLKSEIDTTSLDEEIFFIVEDMPSFQGQGQEGFREWISENLVYPENAKSKGIIGRVYIQFAVNPKGEVVDVKVVRSVHPDLDAEAVRLVESSPVWIPGKQRGKNITVQFTFPIDFVLE